MFANSVCLIKSPSHLFLLLISDLENIRNCIHLIFNDLLFLNKRIVLIFPKSNFQFFLCIHHNRAVPCNRLTDRLPGYKKKSDWLIFCLNQNFITVCKQYQRSVRSIWFKLDIKIIFAVDFIGKRLFLLAQKSLSINDICEDCISSFGCMDKL